MSAPLSHYFGPAAGRFQIDDGNHREISLVACATHIYRHQVATLVAVYLVGHLPHTEQSVCRRHEVEPLQARFANHGFSLYVSGGKGRAAVVAQSVEYGRVEHHATAERERLDVVARIFSLH